MSRPIAWLRGHDPGLAALRRAGRAAIVMPAMFAFCDKVLDNPVMSVFAAFSALSGLVFVDFSGSMGERVCAQASLVLAGAGLVALGTALSPTIWLSVLGVAVVGFVATFAGVVSSVLASATVPLIISFILPVTLGGPMSSLPDRLYGWALAGAAGVLAIRFLWPAPTREPLRVPVAQAARMLAGRLLAEVDCVGGNFSADRRAAVATLAAKSTAAVAALQRQFFATPYRPTGLTTASRLFVRLVDELVWLDAVLARMPLGDRPAPSDPAICEVKRSSAALLEQVAELVGTGTGDPEALGADLKALEHARAELEHTSTEVLPLHHARGDEDEFISSLEQSFRAQELSFAVAAIATNTKLAVAARRRSWWQQLVGHQPAGVGSSVSSARERAGAAMRLDSVWLHNSIRCAIALGAATLVAQESGVQHSFWVVLGTLSMLRSNALNTGQNAMRGLGGTVLGFIVGGAIVAAVGANTTVYWALLAPALFFAALAPATISFAAGQAGFTLVLVILYNIVAPTGWTVGLLRVEDVAIGCAVSAVVGILCWPRGAGPAMGRALGAAIADSAAYLRAAIQYGVSRCDATLGPRPGPVDEQRAAAAAARRLDDAFRGFVVERGAKHVPLAEVTSLLSAVAGLRLTADALVDLWDRDAAGDGDRAAARAELDAAGERLADWYDQTAAALAGVGSVPEPSPPDPAADARLITAVRRDLGGEDGTGTALAVRVIWTADHIDAARRLEAAILGPAGEVADQVAGWSLLRA
jgi:uncharacterized membrane protein YccC